MKNLLLLCSIFTQISLNISAHDFSAVNDDGVTIYYNIISTFGKTVNVTYYGTNNVSAAYSGVVNIPSKVVYQSNEYKVKGIGYSAFFGCINLTAVTIPNTVTRIEQYSFYNCTNLSSISVPNSVVQINDDAFDGCTSLPVVNNIRYAGPVLVSVVDKTLTSYNIKEGTTIIERSAFLECTNLSTITIPESVNRIGDSAFGSCTKLSSVTIQNNSISIGTCAFNTTNLPTENGCKYVGTYLVSAVDASTTKIKDGTTVIADNVFYYYNNWPTLPNSIIRIGKNAFSYPIGSTWRVGNFIPESVKFIDNGAYSCNGFNKEFRFSGVLEEVGYIIGGQDDFPNWGMIYCGNVLVESRYPSYVSNINVTQADFKDDVTYIGPYAFSTLSVSSCEIPESITKINSNAFNNCASLKTITVRWQTPLEVDDEIFVGTTNPTTLNVPKGTLEAYRNANVWKQFQTINEYVIPATAISLDKTEMTIDDNETTALVVSFTPEDASYKQLSWESSDESIATITNGVITGHSPGTVTVTGTTIDGSGLSVSCQVTVVRSYNVVSVETDDTKDKIWLENGDDITIKDASKSITVYSQINNVDVSYSRTFKNTNWQPLYVPFDMEVTSELLGNFSFAKFAGTYTEDDGSFFITIAKLKDGDNIKANTPYFVKAKVADSSNPQTISVAGTTLHATAETENYMLSAEKKVSIFGIYNKKTFTAEEVAEKNVYGYGGGTYNPQTAGQTLGAFRFYIKLTDREDNMYGTDTPSSIKLKVLGDDDATSIDNLKTSTESDANIYDLSGRAVSNPKHGVYIKNGKKYYVK